MKRMVILIVALSLLFLVSCNIYYEKKAQTQEMNGGSQEINLSITTEQMIAEATHILRATCTGETKEGPYSRFHAT